MKIISFDILRVAKNIIKMPFVFLSSFCYRYLRRRKKEHALLHIHNCKNINSVLKTEAEVKESLQKLKKLKLRPHNEHFKNWDSYRVFSFILKYGSAKSYILDVGCADYGVILPWLELYGFSNLYGCDISFKEDFRKGHINYSRQNLESTSFKSDSFDFITSISVIEHGVNLENYFREMSRLLKPGGYSLTSADYWPEPIDTKGIYPYGEEFGEMKVFTREDIEELVKKAEKYGLKLIEPIDFSYKEKVVHWKRVNKRFTFILLIFKKEES